MPKTHTFSPVWTADHVPMHPQFDDIYFNKQDGAAETNYVFLEGNNLSCRFAALEADHHFTIAELGFGTGLNFFLTHALWQNTAPPHARLTFVSFEKYPLSAQDIQTALSPWQNDIDQQFLQRFLEQYIPDTGWHKITIDNMTLHLAIGDIHNTLSNLTHTVDAWFLDGFAPAKNPDMWTDRIFKTMAQYTSELGTFSTFTAASYVRKSLESAGFKVDKTKGYGFKRHMLKGKKQS